MHVRIIVCGPEPDCQRLEDAVLGEESFMLNLKPYRGSRPDHGMCRHDREACLESKALGMRSFRTDLPGDSDEPPAGFHIFFAQWPMLRFYWDYSVFLYQEMDGWEDEDED